MYYGCMFVFRESMQPNGLMNLGKRGVVGVIISIKKNYMAAINHHIRFTMTQYEIESRN